MFMEDECARLYMSYIESLTRHAQQMGAFLPFCICLSELSMTNFLTQIAKQDRILCFYLHLTGNVNFQNNGTAENHMLLHEVTLGNV